MLKRSGVVRLLHVAAVVWLLAPAPVAQIHQGPFTEDFPPEEFAARRTRVMERIGDGVAILQGTTERPGEQLFRQSNQFEKLMKEPGISQLIKKR